MASEREALDFGDNVDVATFDQILEMDDPEDDGDEFSRSIVFGFLEQAEQTFSKMKTELENKNLQELSALGHFLKGSSATLGFNKVRDECEKIQHYGQKKDETGVIDEPDEKKCLHLIAESLAKAQSYYKVVKSLMDRYYSS